MNWTVVFVILVLIGSYFVYIKPKVDVFNGFKNNPEFSHYMLIIESNSEFDSRSYEKFMKHMKLFLMYYSQSFENSSSFDKMKNQHQQIIKYLNRMLLSIPNSMKRYTYMKNSIDNIDSILRSYIQSVALKHNIHYINI
jgi:hypothetical protein